MIEGGLNIKLSDPAIVQALIQHCVDNMNTETGEVPSFDSEVEAILYYFLITMKGSSK